MFFFSVLITISFHKLFCPVPNLSWYAARLNPVPIRAEVMIWNRRTLKNMEVNLQGFQQENESGIKCWLAGLVYLKSAAILSKVGNLTIFL